MVLVNFFNFSLNSTVYELQAICPADGDDVILSSSDVCKVLHEKLSEVGMSMLVKKNASNKDITSDIGFSADFLKSLQSFVEKNTTLTKSIGEDDSSNNLKNFLPRISGISRRQLEVFVLWSWLNVSPSLFFFASVWSF